MEALLEQQRRIHEERERLEKAMAEEVLHKKQSSKEQINADHQVTILPERSASVAKTLAIFMRTRMDYVKKKLQHCVWSE